jgi:hypothetical protein
MDWSQQTAVILAGGPSLTADQVMHVWACSHDDDPTTKVIAVNRCYTLAPWADVFYAGDYMFWKKHIDRMKKVKGTHTQFWTQDRAAHEHFHLNYVKGVNREGLGIGLLHTGGNSGAQAINLAFHWGCRRILLLGMDMKEGPKGEKHWHGDHEKDLVQKQTFAEWIHRFEKIAADLKARGCEVVNCSPGSALPWFRMSTIEEELV